MHNTEKSMLSGIHHDAGMSPPDRQVTRLRNCDPPEFAGSLIKVGRARVLERETGARIKS